MRYTLLHRAQDRTHQRNVGNSFLRTTPVHFNNFPLNLWNRHCNDSLHCATLHPLNNVGHISDVLVVNLSIRRLRIVEGRRPPESLEALWESRRYLAVGVEGTGTASFAKLAVFRVFPSLCPQAALHLGFSLFGAWEWTCAKIVMTHRIEPLPSNAILMIFKVLSEALARRFAGFRDACMLWISVVRFATVLPVLVRLQLTRQGCFPFANSNVYMRV